MSPRLNQLKSYHFRTGGHLGWRSELRSKVGVVVGEGVGRRRWIQGGAKVLRLLLEARAVSKPLDGRVGTFLAVRFSLDGHHHGVGVGAIVVDLATGLLSLLGAVFVVRILHLVQHSQPLGLGNEGSPVLVAQCLPFLSKVLREKYLNVKKYFESNRI